VLYGAPSSGTFSSLESLALHLNVAQGSFRRGPKCGSLDRNYLGHSHYAQLLSFAIKANGSKFPAYSKRLRRSPACHCATSRANGLTIIQVLLFRKLWLRLFDCS